MSKSLEEMAATLREFVEERAWGRFHSPKDLAVLVSVESGELLEQFQWLATGRSEELGQDRLAKVQDEMADVLIGLVRLSDELGVSLMDAAWQKIQKNREKYPTEVVKGSAKKYTEY